MQCNKRFLGQKYYEKRALEREFCSTLGCFEASLFKIGFNVEERLCLSVHTISFDLASFCLSICELVHQLLWDMDNPASQPPQSPST